VRPLRHQIRERPPKSPNTKRQTLKTEN
jgi:hypothetical protein